jgi:hypothetical protein
MRHKLSSLLFTRAWEHIFFRIVFTLWVIGEVRSVGSSTRWSGKNQQFPSIAAHRHSVSWNKSRKADWEKQKTSLDPLWLLENMGTMDKQMIGISQVAPVYSCVILTDWSSQLLTRINKLRLYTREFLFYINKFTDHFIIIRNCWTEMLARSLGHIIILVHFRSKR